MKKRPNSGKAPKGTVRKRPEDGHSAGSAAREAAMALHDAREHARVLFDESPSAMLLIDAETATTIAANQAARALLGYSADELGTLHISDLDALETPEQAKAHIRRILAAGAEGFETQLRTKQGDLRDVRVSVRTVSLDGRQMIYGIFDNVTASKTAERALIKSEQALRNAERIARVGSYVADFAADAWTSSDELDRIFGIDAHYVRSVSNWLAIVHPEWRPRMADYLTNHVIARRMEFDTEYKIVRVNDGVERWVHGRGVLECDAQDRPRWLRGTIQDITERKLQEADRLLQSAALNAAANGIVITDRSGAIKWVNAAFTALTGYEAAEVVDQNPRLLKSGKHDGAFYRDMWETVLAGRTWHGRMTNRRKDGTLYLERQTIAPIVDSAGNIAHFVAVKEDVTESVRLQQQLLQAQKMDSVGRLAGGVAHDFNNLLSVILGCTALAMDELPAGHAARATLDEVIRAGQRAAMLTKQLLLFSRQDFQSDTVFSVNELVTDMHKMLQRVLGEDIKITMSPRPDTGNVRMDRGQLEQVLVNLVVNARDAMPAGGTLTIETSNVSRSVVDMLAEEAPAHASATSNDYVMLAVTDTGIGMSEEVKARIFEPFFTTKPIGKGTGLGLSTSHGIITQAGGRLGVFSDEGRGTTVWIFLPVAPGAVGSATPGDAPSVLHGTETILLVEDDASVSRVTAKMLERQGYRVMRASSGPEALRCIREASEPLHLLLTDIVLGSGLDGPELAEHARALQPDLKVLFVSGYAGDVLKLHGLKQQGLPFVQKPFTADSLGGKVREVLDAQ